MPVAPRVVESLVMTGLKPLRGVIVKRPVVEIDREGCVLAEAVPGVLSALTTSFSVAVGEASAPVMLSVRVVARRPLESVTWNEIWPPLFRPARSVPLTPASKKYGVSREAMSFKPKKWEKPRPARALGVVASLLHDEPAAGADIQRHHAVGK